MARTSRTRKGPARRRWTHKRVRTLLLRLAALAMTGGTIGTIYHFVTHRSEARMAPFAAAPKALRSDLLYLSYLDSLAREDRATPSVLEGRDLLPRMVAQVAGVPTSDITEWGLHPPVEAEYDSLSRLFRELHRRGRLILPIDDAALWTHIRERQLHPGYLVFGRTPAVTEGIDFCAILTAVNIAQPEYSILLYRDPVTGRLLHGRLQDLPHIAYLGGGRLGSDLSRVYMDWFRLQDQRGKKPLFPH